MNVSGGPALTPGSRTWTWPVPATSRLGWSHLPLFSNFLYWKHCYRSGTYIFFFQFNFNKSANRQSFHFQKNVGTLKIKKKKRDICKHSFLLHSTLIQVVVTASHFGNWSCTVNPIGGRSRSWQPWSSNKNFHFKCTVSGSFDIAW